MRNSNASLRQTATRLYRTTKMQLSANDLVHVCDFLPAAASARCGATSKVYAKASSWHLANNYIWTAERKEVLTPSHYEQEYTYKEDRHEEDGGGSFTRT